MDERWQRRLVTADEVECDLFDRALHRDQRRVVRVVKDPARHRQQILEAQADKLVT
jgi:hypothetical protein